MVISLQRFMRQKVTPLFPAGRLDPTFFLDKYPQLEKTYASPAGFFSCLPTRKTVIISAEQAVSQPVSTGFALYSLTGQQIN